MEKEMIEYYHDRGLMPDWWYYQVNGKTAEENYIDMVNRRSLKFRDEMLREEEKKELEKELEAKLEETLEKVLNDLLKDFNT
mgnify:CR=1 FL=1